MTAAIDLWAAIGVSYDTASLRSLTNIHDRAATSVNDTVGVDASQGAINLFPIYAQVDYDETNDLHVEVGKRAVIALLWERGGTAAQAAKQEWDEVFTDGVVERLKREGPRARVIPKSNSGVTQQTETLADGSRPMPWADRSALPSGLMPGRRSSDPFR